MKTMRVEEVKQALAPDDCPECGGGGDGAPDLSVNPTGDPSCAMCGGSGKVRTRTLDVPLPRWLSHPLSRERAEKLGLSGEPECAACAEWVYCGTVTAAHTCPHSFPVTDPHLDAPDGAVVDGHVRILDRWVRVLALAIVALVIGCDDAMTHERRCADSCMRGGGRMAEFRMDEDGKRCLCQPPTDCPIPLDAGTD